MASPSEPLETDRARLWASLCAPRTWDLAVVGGGATGLGVALDAALRGLSVVLVESHDFASGTSSRATKLVHGGVRYLAQGNLSLVHEALHERTRLLSNAPHLAQPLPFVMPAYQWWEAPFYGLGLKLYDMMAGQAGLGATEWLSAAQTQRLLPTAQPAHLHGGVKYWDGQFDDARLALVLARSAAAGGALVLNYCEAVDVLHTGARVSGLRCRNAETGATVAIQARCVVNATGVWVDALRHQDAAAAGASAQPMVAPSQGVHLVVGREFFPGDHALLVPKTADGRVLFAIPWLGKVILGTTDTPRQDLPREPEPLAEEVAFILDESARYLVRAPSRGDVSSVWVGLRPLVKPAQGDGQGTKAISREHTVRISPSGLVTVTGGKWTTYRAMAADVLGQCQQAGLLKALPACTTAHHRLVGAPESATTQIRLSEPPGIHLYGTEAAALQALPGANDWIAPHLSAAMVRFAARHEYARTVEDVLARRNRLLFLDARAAAQAAPAVAAILQQELAHAVDLDGFAALAAQYSRLP